MTGNGPLTPNLVHADWGHLLNDDPAAGALMIGEAVRLLLIAGVSLAVVSGLVWAAAVFDQWLADRPAHRACPICHPRHDEPPSNLDRWDGIQ